MLLCLRALDLQSWRMPGEDSCKMQPLGNGARSSGILLNPPCSIPIVESDPCGQRHTFAGGPWPAARVPPTWGLRLGPHANTCKRESSSLPLSIAQLGAWARPVSPAATLCLGPGLLLAVRGLSSGFACGPACLSVYFTLEQGSARRPFSQTTAKGMQAPGGLAAWPRSHGGVPAGVPGCLGRGCSQLLPLGLGSVQQRGQMGCEIQVSVGQPPPREHPPPLSTPRGAEAGANLGLPER